MRNLQQLRESVNEKLWEYEIKQRDANLKTTNAYRNELQDLYRSWLSEFLEELEATPDEDRQEYIVAALLLLGRRLKELQRIRLLEAFDMGLAGEPVSPEALEELSNHIREQERYIDESLMPHLETHFLDRLEELPEIGQEKFEESLSKRAYRVGLYAGAFWTVMQLAQWAISQPERTCTWIAHDDEGTCPDCAAYSGKTYTKATLPTLPGVEVQCNGNCRCALFWHEPLESFT